MRAAAVASPALLLRLVLLAFSTAAAEGCECSSEATGCTADGVDVSERCGCDEPSASGANVHEALPRRWARVAEQGKEEVKIELAVRELLEACGLETTLRFLRRNIGPSDRAAAALAAVERVNHEANACLAR